MGNSMECPIAQIDEQRFYEATPEERIHKIYYESCSAVLNHMFYKCCLLTSLYTPIEDRHKGYATGLIKELNQHVGIILTPSTPQLMNWYKSMGFLVTDFRPTIRYMNMLNLPLRQYHINKEE